MQVNWCDTNFYTKVVRCCYIYTLLLETGMPEWPWFSRCSCVHWCKNSPWKADYWKELLEPVFTMWGGCVPDSESLPTLKNIIWPPWSRASARLDSSCTPWVICEWWEWQIIVHFPWLWLILRVKVFLCCYRSGGLLKPSLNAPLSCREGQTLIFFLLWLLKWRYGSFPSRNGFTWL